MKRITRAATLVAASTVLAWAGAAAAPLPDAVSAEIFAAPPAVENPTLSPSGTMLAAKILVNGRQTLVVTPLAAGGTPAAFAAGDVDVNWWRWVNDDWLLVGVGSTQSIYGIEAYMTRVVSVSKDMTKFNEIDWRTSGQFADDVIWTAKDGSARFLLSKQTGFERESDWEPSVFEVDASTGKSKLVIGPRGVDEWYADAQGNLRMGRVSKDGDDSILYRANNSASFVRLKDSDEPGKSLPSPLLFRPDGSAVTIHDASGFDEVYEMTLPDFRLGRKLYSAPGYDVDALHVSATNDRLVGMRHIGTKPHWEWLDPAYKAVQQRIDQTFGADNGRIVSQDRSGTKFIIEAGGPDQAGGIYFWDTAGGSPQLIGYNNAQLRGRQLSPVKSIRYSARDGTSIPAVLTLPRGRAAKGLPLIVMPHGGPAARDHEMFDWWTQFLAEQGYAVIQPNYRGSTGYGRAFFDKGKGEWGLKMQDDLIDAIGWAAAQGIADAKRVCIVGASYGGYAAMRGAQRDRSSYRCAISYAGVSDLKGMLAYDNKFFNNEAKAYWKKSAPDLAAVSPRFHAGEFGVPILIAHGAKDKRVPIKQSRAMVDGLQKAGKPVVYLEQKQGDHHFSRTEDRLEFLKAMKAFLDRHNPA